MPKTPVHIKASRDDIAGNMLISDDRDRIVRLSGMLERTKIVSDSRGFLVYTGEYSGFRVSLGSHGIGAPSCAIFVEEASMLGVTRMVMFGTAGPLVPEIGLGDFVIPTESAHTSGGFYRGYRAQDMAKVPDADLTKRLVSEFRSNDMPVHTGKVYASDTYYAEDKDFVSRRRREGNISVEMDSAALFMLGKIRGFAASAVFIASNAVASKRYASESLLEKRSVEGAEAIFNALRAP